MNPDAHDLGDLQMRLAALERQNRRFKQLGVAVLVGATLFLALGQAPAKRTVEANEFILKDGNGKVRATLRMGGDFFAMPELNFIDEKGTTRLRLWGGRERVGDPANFSGVSVLDEHGRERGMLDADANGAALAFMNAKGSDDALVRAEGIMVSGPVTVSDEQGFRATLGTTDLTTPRTGEAHRTSAASLVLFDKDKKVIWKAP